MKDKLIKPIAPEDQSELQKQFILTFGSMPCSARSISFSAPAIYRWCHEEYNIKPSRIKLAKNLDKHQANFDKLREMLDKL